MTPEETLKEKVESRNDSINETLDNIRSLEEESSRTRDSIIESLKKIKRGDASINETMSNITSIMEKINSLLPIGERHMSDKESVNENDSKEEDELAVAHLGPGRE